jgi:CysZ protein
MLYFAGISLAILCLSFIPAAGTVIFTVVSFYWICRYSAFEFVCYSADRRRLPWKEVWRMLRGNWPVSSGFGAMTALLLMIPFVNVLIVTVSAVGGTFLFGLIQRGATDGSGEKQTESEITPPSREPAGGAWV